MIISAPTDYRAAAKRRLPPFLFHYIDGGAYAEETLRRNVADLSGIALRQRILRNMAALSLTTELFGETLSMPVALGPVGLTGMALGADAVLLGRAYSYALGAAGQAGVEHLLDLFAKEIQVAMTLTGAKTIAEINREALVSVTSGASTPVA